MLAWRLISSIILNLTTRILRLEADYPGRQSFAADLAHLPDIPESRITTEAEFIV